MAGPETWSKPERIAPAPEWNALTSRPSGHREQTRTGSAGAEQ